MAIIPRGLPRRPAAAALAAVLSGVAVVGCSPDRPDPEVIEHTVTVSETATPAPAEATTAARIADGVRQVHRIFATLAPDSFFERLDDCEEGSLPDTWECSGTEIGSFSFTESHATAARSVSGLTELRSSHVVSDDGTRVVGWGALGTSTIITVVDTEHGTVMRKLVDDRSEPEDIIHELGLAEDGDGEGSGSGTATATADDAEEPSPDAQTPPGTPDRD